MTVLELRLAVPYAALPGGAHLSKARVCGGSCLVEFAPARRRLCRPSSRVLREFVALLCAFACLALFAVGVVDVVACEPPELACLADVGAELEPVTATACAAVVHEEWSR